MGAVLVIARMITEYPFTDFAALGHHLCHYLPSSKILVDKPHTKVQKQDKEFTGKDEDIHNDESHVRIRVWEAKGMICNSNPFDTLEWRKPVLDNVMEALRDPNTHTIGVYGTNDEMTNILLQRVWRRIDRDKLFNVVLAATITKKQVIKKIQEELADQLGFDFREKSEDGRASELHDKIKNERKIVIILCDLCKRLELGKVGIPFGTDHTGCKILLTSTREEVLSNQMHTQKNFMV